MVAAVPLAHLDAHVGAFGVGIEVLNLLVVHIGREALGKSLTESYGSYCVPKAAVAFLTLELLGLLDTRKLQ